MRMTINLTRRGEEKKIEKTKKSLDYAALDEFLVDPEAPRF